MQVELGQSSSTLIVDLEGRRVAGGLEEMFRGVINELIAAAWRQISEATATGCSIPVELQSFRVD